MMTAPTTGEKIVKRTKTHLRVHRRRKVGKRGGRKKKGGVFGYFVLESKTNGG